MSRQINLLNPALLKGPVRLPARQMLLGWAGVLLAGIGLYVWAYARTEQLRVEETSATAQVQKLQTDLVRLGGEAAGRKPSAALVARAEQRQGMLEARQGTMNLLNDGSIGVMEGHSRFLQAFARQAVGGLWLTGITVDGSGAQIALHGRTMDPALVPEFLRRLGNEPALAGHGFDRLHMQRPLAVAGTGTAPAVPPPYIDFSVETRPRSGTTAGEGKS